MSKIEMTVEEIIATIRRSNVYNVVVEGKDDVVAYRYLESGSGDGISRPIAIVGAGGRTKVLEIFERLVGDDCIDRCAFICDQDAYIFKGIPAEYSHDRLHFTFGYSLENDLIIDRDPATLFRGNEREQFDLDLERYARWFSVTVLKLLRDEACNPATHVNQVLDGSEPPEICSTIQTDKDAAELHGQILSAPRKLLRGKSLLALYVRYLSSSKRSPKHSPLALIEHGAAENGAMLRRLRDAVRANFAPVV